MESDSTLGFKGRAGLDDFRDAVGETLVDQSVESERPDAFWARLTAEEVGGITLVDTTITAVRSVRTVARSPGDGSVFLLSARTADGVIAHRRGEEEIRPGRLVVVPSEEEFDVRYRGTTRVQFLVLPSEVVERRFPRLDGPVRSVGLSEVGAALVGHLDAVREQLARNGLSAASRAALSGVLDPVVDGLVGETGAVGGPGVGARLATVRLAAERFIDRHLGDPGLGAGAVAGAIDVPLRTLQRAFRADGDTVGSHIRIRRLERAAQRLAAEPVAVARIAAELGYASVAQFAAQFHERYGVGPAGADRA
jgi:AraC-like DNA-binding protein